MSSTALMASLNKKLPLHHLCLFFLKLQYILTERGRSMGMLRKKLSTIIRALHHSHTYFCFAAKGLFTMHIGTRSGVCVATGAQTGFYRNKNRREWKRTKYKRWTNVFAQYRTSILKPTPKLLYFRKWD